DNPAAMATFKTQEKAAWNTGDNLIIPDTAVDFQLMEAGKGVGKIILVGLALIFLSSQQVSAQEERIKGLEEKIQILAEEVDALKEKQPEGIEKKLHFHGYGELHYNNTSEDGKNDKMDLHRMVLGWTYHFNDWIVLGAEVDFEHSASEMELEYAHLSFLLSDAFNIRIGSMLMPVGYLNEFHEPPLFYSVERPYVHAKIIPTNIITIAPKVTCAFLFIFIIFPPPNTK
ncbi:hypothetical protein LCGC14_2890890, partial [marine sediment metagenome]